MCNIGERGMKGKALIIDNDFLFVEFLERILTGRGYRVWRSYRAGKGLEMVRRQDFDLIFMDYMISYADGEQIIEFLKGWAKEKGIVVVVYSGCLLEQMESAKDMGVDYLIIKGPINNMKREIEKVLEEVEQGGGQRKTKIIEPRKIWPRQETARLLDHIRYMKSIINSLPMGIIFVDSDGIITGCNIKATDILDLSTEDLLGRRIWELSEGSDINRLRDLIRDRTTHQGDEQIMEMVFNGKTLTISAISLIFDYETNGWVFILKEKKA